MDYILGDVTIKAAIDRKDVPNNRICTLRFYAAIDTQSNTPRDLTVTITLHNLPHVFDHTFYSIPATVVIDSVTTPALVSLLLNFLVQLMYVE